MIELYPHQRKAVDQLHNGAILWGDVGTGKSLTAAAYYMEKEAPKDVIVITTAKKRDSLDWEREFVQFGVGTDGSASTAGVLRVDSWNNLHQYRDRAGCFFIFDEQRVVGSGKWTKDFIRIAQNNRWLLLSATPGDTWLDYIPVFIANGFYRNRTEFLREHVVYNRYSKFPKVDRYVNVGRLVRLRNDLLVHMQYQRHTIRQTTNIPVDYDQDAFRRVLEDRWHIYLDRPLRDVAELFLVMRKVVNSSGTRLEAIRSLISKHPRLIVFYNFDYELEALRSLANTIVMENQSETIQVAEWNGHKHQAIPDSERWVYLVQYQAGSEGWNCISTDAMVFYSLTYSYKNWHQAHGRIDRLNTPFKVLHYYVLLSNSIIDKAIMRSLMGKKSFNESKWLRKILTTDSQDFTRSEPKSGKNA